MEIDTKTNDKIYNLTVKGQNDRKIEIQIATKSTLDDLLQRIDDLTKDKESCTYYNALITEEYKMTTTFDNIIGLTDGSVLTLAQSQPNRHRILEPNVGSTAFSNLVRFRTLMGNLRPCNRYAQQDQESNLRMRYNHPEGLESLPPQPSMYHHIS